MNNVIEKNMQSIREINKDTKLCIMTLCVQIVTFYYNISQIGFATHDEIAAYITYTNPEFSIESVIRGRMDVIGLVLSVFQFNSSSIEMYRLYTLIGILLSIIAASVFIRHHISKTDYLKYAILFFAFLQIGHIHNGAISFSVDYQYKMFWCFLFLDFFLTYYKTRKKVYYVLGSVFWCIAINSYEAFYMFCFVLFLFSFVCLEERKAISIKNLIIDLWLPALITIFSFIGYISRGAAGDYDGAAIDVTYSWLEKIESVLIYSFGMKPLSLNMYTQQEIVKIMSQLSYENLLFLLKALLVAYVLSKAIVLNKLDSVKKKIIAIVISTVSIILPSFLVGITARHLDWSINGGLIIYGCSYYSYFFIALLLILILGCLSTIKNKHLKFIIRVCTFVIVFYVSLVTDLNNVVVAESYDREDNKYDAFNEAVKSDYFSSIEDGSIIYAPQMIGVHNQIFTLDSYCKQVTGKNVVFCNQLEAVDFSKNVYMMRYVQDSDVMLLAKVEDTRLCSNEILILFSNEISNQSICMQREDNAVTDMYIYDDFVGKYGNYVALSLANYIDKKDIVLYGNNMSVESLEVVVGNVNDSVEIDFLYGEGVSYQEDFGRWIAKRSQYIIYSNENIDNATMYITLFSATGEEGVVDVIINDEILSYGVTSVPITIELDLDLVCGENIIELVSSLNSMETIDPRDINMCLLDASCEINNEIYKFR